VSKRVITGYKHIVKIEQYISDLYFTYQTDIIDVIGVYLMKVIPESRHVH
jgi:hypothetical protein